MSLIYKIVIRTSIVLSVLIAVWAVLFYVAITNEVNDEVDDALESYSETIIKRALSGDSLPSQDNGSNNQYYLTEVTREYAKTHPTISYSNEMIYVEQLSEEESARVLNSIFRDQEGRYFQLTVSTPVFESDDMIGSILLWIIVLFGALILSVVMVVVVVFHNSMKPLYTLLKWLDNFKLGKQNEALVNNTSIKEFRKLNDTVTRFSNRSEQLFEQQKEFIGNASHEIQTPLAICQNRIEILLEEQSMNEYQQEELSKIHGTITHISRMNKSLLLLSKIDNGQFIDKKRVSINHVIEQTLPDYLEVFQYKNIVVNVEAKEELTLLMSETLSILLVSNLVKNCFVHTSEGGAISIKITGSSLLFSNSGTTSLDASRIFERFYQGSKRENSTGLGLSIVDSICKLENLSIHYFFENNYHCFKIS